MDPLLVATILTLLVLLASIASVELGLSVAIIEIAAGVIAGNALGLTPPSWMDFLASFAGILLTFLAGAEVDPGVMRQKLKESVLIGGLSFLLPFFGVGVFAYFVAGWDLRQSEIAGMALALSILFIQPTPYLGVFVLVSVAVIVAMIVLQRQFFDRYGDRVIEPEIRGAVFALLLLMWTADLAKSQAVLPAFLLGLAIAPIFKRHPEQQRRFRVVAFSFLTPFFFLKGGM